MENERPLRSVFIGNIPYEVTEEKLKEIFSEVGPIISMKMVYDRESGKPKGYGFCEYKDVDTAMSAMRNLNGYEINGRILRVDNAGAERHRMQEMQERPSERERDRGPGNFNGPRHDEQFNNPQHWFPPDEHEMDIGPPPEKTPEVISKAVASLPPEQMFELMKQMKMCIQNNPNEARTMLLQNPQLAYALLQAQVVMKIIDPAQALAMLHHDNGVAMGNLLPEGQMPAMVPPPRQGFGPGPGGPPRHPDNPWISGAPLMPLNPPGPFGQGPPMGGAGPGGDLDFRQMDPRMRNPPSGPHHQDLDLRSEPHHRGSDRFQMDPRHRADADRDMRMGRAGGMGRDSDLRDPRMQQQPAPPSTLTDPRARARAERDQAQAQKVVATTTLPAGMAASFGPGTTDSEKAALIMQVLQLSDEQIAMLPPEQRQSILVLKEQIAKAGNR